MIEYKLNRVEVCPHCATQVAKGQLRTHKCPDSKPMNTWRQKNLAIKEEKTLRFKANELGIKGFETDSVKVLKEKIAKVEASNTETKKLKDSGIKELRKQAEDLGIPHFNKMTPTQLADSIKTAKLAEKK